MQDQPGPLEPPAGPAGETTVPPPLPAEAITLPPPSDPLATQALAEAVPQAVPDARAPAGYAIEKELGRGGMGVVYQARSLALQRTCALKMILSGAHSDFAEIARFRTEAQAIARLSHPHIVQVYEIGEHEGRPFMALEFCSGGSLDALLAKQPLSPRQAASLVRSLALAVQAAHEANVLHRDLKPANVLLANSGQESEELIPKITDFGLAKKLDEGGLTRTGSVMGTPSYMPPEQAEGNKAIGPAADIYALGAVLYECLTGKPPFQGPTALDVLMQVLEREPVAPRDINPAIDRDLQAIVMRCLEKEARARYASARALADDLDRWLQGLPVRARPITLIERQWRWLKRTPLVQSILVGGALVAFLLGIISAGGLDFFAMGMAIGLSALFALVFLAMIYLGMREQKRLNRQIEQLARSYSSRPEPTTVPAAPATTPSPGLARRSILLGMLAGAVQGMAVAATLVAALFLGLNWPPSPVLPWLLLALCQGATLGACLGALVQLQGPHPVRAGGVVKWVLLLELIGVISWADWAMVPGADDRNRYFVWIALLMFLLPGLTEAGLQLQRWLDRHKGDLGKARLQVVRLSYDRHYGKLLTGGLLLAAVFLPGAIVGQAVGYELAGAVGAVVGQVLGPVLTWAPLAFLGWFRPLEASELTYRRPALIGLMGAAAMGWLLWSTSTISEGREHWKAVGAASQIVPLPKDRVLVVGQRDSVDVWDLRQSKKVQSLPSNHRWLSGPGLQLVGVGPGDDQVFVGQRDAVHIHALGQPAEKPIVLPTGRPALVAACAARKALLVQPEGIGSLYLWDLEKQRAVQRVALGDSLPRCLAWSADGQYALVGYEQGQLDLIRLTAPIRRRRLYHALGPIGAVAFSPDSQFAYAAGSEWTIRRWEVGTGAPAGEFFGHRGGINSLSFTPDGSTLLSCSDDRTLRLWAVGPTGLKQTAILRGHAQLVQSATFLSDERAVSCGIESADNVYLWKLP